MIMTSTPLDEHFEKYGQYMKIFSKITKRNVVVLGSRIYKEEVVNKISVKLLDNNLLPTPAFKITQTIEEHITPRQRICWFLSNSVFVIAEDSVPSGEIVELEYCKNIGVTTCILHDKNLPRSSWMTLDADIHTSDFKCFRYDKNNLDSVIDKAIKWAFDRNEEKSRQFSKNQKEQDKRNKVFDRPRVKEAIQMLKDNL